jgi:hypothetical protein
MQSKRFQLAVVASIAISGVAHAATVLDRVYPLFMTGARQFSDVPWVEMSAAELPEPFRDDYSRQRYVISAFRLPQTATILIFKVQRPTFVSEGQFCRSRVRVEALYSYDPDRPYFEQPRMDLADAFELVAFGVTTGEGTCRADHIEDFDDYVLVNGRLEDNSLIQMWRNFDAARRGDDSKCRISSDARLVEMGVAPAGDDLERNVYVLTAKSKNAVVTITLRQSGAVYARASCETARVTG